MAPKIEHIAFKSSDLHRSWINPCTPGVVRYNPVPVDVPDHFLLFAPGFESNDDSSLSIRPFLGYEVVPLERFRSERHVDHVVERSGNIDRQSRHFRALLRRLPIDREDLTILARIKEAQPPNAEYGLHGLLALFPAGLDRGRSDFLLA